MANHSVKSGKQAQLLKAAPAGFKGRISRRAGKYICKQAPLKAVKCRDKLIHHEGCNLVQDFLL